MPAALLLSLLLTLPLSAQGTWPSSFQVVPPQLKPLPEKNEALAWETPHFVLVSEVALSAPRLRDFGLVIESIPQLFQTLPLPLWAPPEGKKAVIRICKGEASFVARGGPLGAAGYYHGRQAMVLLRGDLLLNPPQAEATNLRAQPDDGLLVHELCHLAMFQLGSLPPWLTEGLAEYFASCHLGKGSYQFADSRRRIPARIRQFYPRDRFPEIVLPPLAEIAGLSSQKWIQANKLTDPKDRYRPYISALLLVHYHLEGGSQRRHELADFLQKSHADQVRQPGAAVLQFPRNLETTLVSFWKEKGLALSFAAEK